MLIALAALASARTVQTTNAEAPRAPAGMVLFPSRTASLRLVLLVPLFQSSPRSSLPMSDPISSREVACSLTPIQNELASDSSDVTPHRSCRIQVASARLLPMLRGLTPAPLRLGPAPRRPAPVMGVSDRMATDGILYEGAQRGCSSGASAAELVRCGLDFFDLAYFSQ